MLPASRPTAVVAAGPTHLPPRVRCGGGTDASATACPLWRRDRRVCHRVSAVAVEPTRLPVNHCKREHHDNLSKTENRDQVLLTLADPLPGNRATRPPGDSCRRGPRRTGRLYRPRTDLPAPVSLGGHLGLFSHDNGSTTRQRRTVSATRCQRGRRTAGQRGTVPARRWPGSGDGRHVPPER